MASFALAVPVQPGKTQALREYTAQLAGPKFSEEQAFHHRALPPPGIDTANQARRLRSVPACGGSRSGVVTLVQAPEPL